MRRLNRAFAPNAKAFLIHSGQTAALCAVAVLAMAAAPAVEPQPYLPDAEAAVEAEAVPVAPPVTAVVEAAGPVTRQIAFEAPVRGYRINSLFGLRRLGGEGKSRPHRGVDIAAPTGTGVFSSAEGEVIRTGYQPTGYGRFIELRHPNGMTSLYAHLSRIDVASGDRVSGGERIGLVGSTGYSTGPHLHFEIKRDGVHVNPSRVVGRTFQVAVEMPS